MLEIVSFAELVDLKEAFFLLMLNFLLRCYCSFVSGFFFFFFFFTAYANSPIMQFRTMMFNLWYSLFTLSSPHYTSMTCHPHFSCFLPIVKYCFVCCLPLPCEILFCLLPPFATQATDFKWNLVGWKYHTASWHGSEKSGRQDSHWISQIGHLCWFLSVSVSVNSFMTAVSVYDQTADCYRVHEISTDFHCTEDFHWREATQLSLNLGDDQVDQIGLGCPELFTYMIWAYFVRLNFHIQKKKNINISGSVLQLICFSVRNVPSCGFSVAHV